jgi:4-amino-4-deoxy-L-arabinose transferase-like glycosyltransferase
MVKMMYLVKRLKRLGSFVITIKAKTHLEIALVVVTCLIGLFLRAHFYSVGRSLWLDEAMLALNIVNRPFLDLLKPLDLNQAAPIGFLLLQKAVISLLGTSDYSLRMIPFLAGLVSVPLMYAVSKQYVAKSGALISLGLFALSPRLIYYSSELKQYSTDVLVTLLILLVAPKCLEDKVKPHKLIGLGIIGFLAIWFSHPSLFVFAGVLLSLGLTFVFRRDKHNLSWLIGSSAIWIAGLALNYFINLRYLESNDTLVRYWSSAFAPLPPWDHFSWYYNAFISMLKDPATLPTSTILVGILVVGISSLAFRRWPLMLVLLAPFLLTLLASALERYPFNGRLLLFILPSLFLLLAEGVKRIRIILAKVKKPLADLVYASLILYLLYNPASISYNNLRFPPMGEHIKPVMEYIQGNYHSGDLIYVYYGARPAFEFYMPFYRLDRSSCVGGVAARNEPLKYLEDIEKLRGNRRVWFIFSHNCSWCIVNEQQFILEYLDQIGIKRDELLSDGASVYLYDLGKVQ